MTDSVACPECGRALPEVESGPSKLMPCPHCGAGGRQLSVVHTDGVGAVDQALLERRREGELTGFGESGRQGRAASADMAQSGETTFAITGNSPQGEDDTLLCCSTLISCLNASGGEWEDPKLAAGGVDCTSSAKSGLRLDIQVIRALTDQAFWRELNAEGRVERRTMDFQPLVTALRTAIEKKADTRKVTPRDRHSIRLALDATRLPVLCFDAVRRLLRQELSTWATTLGFAAIWVVGPSAHLTWRLDEPTAA
jgi:hypothetical protein